MTRDDLIGDTVNVIYNSNGFEFTPGIKDLIWVMPFGNTLVPYDAGLRAVIYL